MKLKEVLIKQLKLEAPRYIHPEEAYAIGLFYKEYRYVSFLSSGNGSYQAFENCGYDVNWEEVHPILITDEYTQWGRFDIDPDTGDGIVIIANVFRKDVTNG